MDIEQLKLILDTVSAVSGDAATIVISYIVFDTVLPFVGWMAVLFTAYKAAMKCLLLAGNEDFFKEMRRQLNTGSGGYLTLEEKRRTMQKLSEIAIEHKRQ